MRHGSLRGNSQPGTSSPLLAKELVGAQILELIIPARVPIGGCAQHFEDPLHSQQRNDEVDQPVRQVHRVRKG
jgi:hypothetical protein